MAKKNSFILYTDYLEYFEMLDNEECGKLIKGILRFARDGVEPRGLSPTANMAFRFIKDQLVRDLEKYEKLCARNRENGALGGRPRKTDGFFEKPKQTLNDTDTENDTDTDTVYDTDNGGISAGGGVGPAPSGTVVLPRGGREKKRGKKNWSGQSGGGSFDTDEFFEAAVARSYRIMEGKE